MFELFQTFVERPIFNLLESIYALIPGHDLGLAIIIFTVVIRLCLWPLVKKQLHQSKAMKKLQPELKRIKKEAGGDKQKQARLQMELYKEHNVKPFSTIGTLIVQIPIFIALYQSVFKLIRDPNILINFSYDWVRDLSWIQHLAVDISQFDHTLLGLVDLSRNGVSSTGVYMPAILVALIASVVQFYQSKMMLPDAGDSRKLSEILKEAGSGKDTDQSEVSAAVGRGMLYFLPVITFVFSVSVPSALALYIFTTSAVGYVQQKFVFKVDTEEMTALVDKSDSNGQKTAGQAVKKPKSHKKSSKRKRRKR